MALTMMWVYLALFVRNREEEWILMVMIGYSNHCFFSKGIWETGSVGKSRNGCPTIVFGTEMTPSPTTLVTAKDRMASTDNLSCDVIARL
jgi:hypothetical protein